jgi:hypothetical protein
VANIRLAPSFQEVWEAFFNAAKKYWSKKKKILVLIIDNANGLAKKQSDLHKQIQGYI